MVSKEDFIVCVSSAGYVKKHSLKTFEANKNPLNIPRTLATFFFIRKTSLKYWR